MPPKPEEPDNCCMSGCVNCVWDLYREEMETWATQMRRAERAKAAAAAAEASEKAKEDGLEVVRRGGDDVSTTAGTPMSMDDDGGGSETNWDLPALATANGEQAPVAKDLWDEQLYKNVPVGIREFMKTEKMLKLKHLREGTTGR